MSSMETTESPLDVLSRAATMVQDSLPPDYDCARPCGATKELPSGRWRRDRREKLGAGYTKHRATERATVVDAPLDMTTPRGMPPPYSQCVGSRPARSSARPSVITCAPRPSPPPAGSPPGQRREQLSDPVIDEHFRRSLGNDYNSLFNDGTDDKCSSVTVTGLSVDDHFAKALGDTWVKLQKSDSDLPSKRDDKSPALATVAAGNKDKPSTAAPTPTATKATSLLQQRRGLVTI